MKTIVINCSPRKNMNTAQILKSATKGAESVGAEVKYYDMYDLQTEGCHSCLACKRAGIADPTKCYWKDGLSPVLEEIKEADNLIIGFPIFFGEPTAMFRALLERLCFPLLSYNTGSSLFKGKVNVSIFPTMNSDESTYQKLFAEKFRAECMPFSLFLKGEVNIYPVYDTQQVKDYSKYDMKATNAEAKYQRHEEEFPKNLERAFQIGARMNKRV